MSDEDCVVKNSYIQFNFEIDEADNYITIARLNANIWTGISIANTNNYACSVYGDSENILVFYGGSLLLEDDYVLDGSTLILNGVETSDNYITVVNLGEANKTPEYVSTIETFPAQVGKREYSVMVSPYNNMLFYDCSLLNIDDYSILSKSVLLNFDPEYDGVDMTFVGFSGVVETAHTVPGTTEYNTVHTAETDNILMFYGPSLLNENDYEIKNGKITFNFVISEPARYTAMNIEGEVQRMWAVVGQTEYDCDVTYDQNMVFFGDSMLRPSDYALVNDKLILSFIPESMVQITVVNYGS